MTTRVLRWAILGSLLLATPWTAAAEDDWYAVWTRSAPVLQPSGLKDFGWADGGDRFTNSVQASAGRIQVLFKFVKGISVEKHVTGDLTFNAPPAQLRVGDTFTMVVQGKMARHDSPAFYAEVAPARVLAGALGIDQKHELSARAPAIRWDLRTKLTTAPRGDFDVTVSLGPGSVTWTYRLQRVRVRPQDAQGVIGRVERAGGQIEGQRAGEIQSRPLVAGSPVYVGMTIRSRGFGGVQIRWNRPTEDGAMVSDLAGVDHAVRIEDMARPGEIGLSLLGGLMRIVRWPFRGPAASKVIRIQAGDISFVPEGTDFLVIHHAPSRTVACYVHEGRVRVEGRGSHHAVVSAGSEITASRGVVGAVRTMRPGQWEGLVKPLRAPEPPSPQEGAQATAPGGFRPEPTALRFFESGTGTPAVAQRVHRMRFAANATRYLNWELKLEYPPPSRRHLFEIVAHWYRPNGSRLATQNLKAHADKGWRYSLHTQGWGGASPGVWQPGWYRVDLHIGGEKIASASFAITD